MLHLYFQDFVINAESPPMSPVNAASSEALELDPESTPTLQQLRSAVKEAANCPQCQLKGDLHDFASWRAKVLKEVSLNPPTVERWSGALQAEIDWAGARYERCLCPFSFGCWGLRWRPSDAEAASLLLAQSMRIGVDFYLKLSNSSSMIPCHSFLLHSLPKRSWPKDSRSRLFKEGGRVVLELDFRFYSPELLQLIFYSAYGYVLHFDLDFDLESSTDSQALPVLTAAVLHLTQETASICGYVADIPGLLTNLIVSVHELIDRISLRDDHLLLAVPQLQQLLQTSQLFNELQQKLMQRLYQDCSALLVTAQLPAAASVQKLHSSATSCSRHCILLDLAVHLLRRLILRCPMEEGDSSSSSSSSSIPNIQCSLQAYLTALVQLNELDAFESTLTALHDARVCAGIVSLLQLPHCSPQAAAFRRMVLQLLHTLLQLAADSLVISCCEAASCRSDRSTSSSAQLGSFWLMSLNESPLLVGHFGFVQSLAGTLPQVLRNLHTCCSENDGYKLHNLLTPPRTEAGTVSPFSMEARRLPRLIRQSRSLQRQLAEAEARDLRSVAYASYSTVRLPRMRCVVQMLALLLGDVVEVAPTNGELSRAGQLADVALAAEGRRLLCSECELQKRLNDFNLLHFCWRLQATDSDIRQRADQLSRAAASDACSLTAGHEEEVEGEETEVRRGAEWRKKRGGLCPEHGAQRTGCVAFAWFSSVMTVANQLTGSLRSFDSVAEFKRGLGQQILLPAVDFFSSRAEELSETGDIERRQLLLLLNAAGSERKKNEQQTPQQQLQMRKKRLQEQQQLRQQRQQNQLKPLKQLNQHHEQPHVDQQHQHHYQQKQWRQATRQQYSTVKTQNNIERTRRPSTFQRRKQLEQEQQQQNQQQQHQMEQEEQQQQQQRLQQLYQEQKVLIEKQFAEGRCFELNLVPKLEFQLVWP